MKNRDPRPCPRCQQPFTPGAYSHAQVFCSKACQLASLHERNRSAEITARPCELCGTVFRPKQKTAAGRFCSRACLYAGTRREKSPQWKGGRYPTGQGYVKVYRPEHPDRDSMGYVLEHRLVMEQQHGRRLAKHETVHHINGDKTDNRPSNLQLRQGRHGKGAAHRCADCGSTNIEAVPIGTA